jgi:hypothetical protein
VKTSEWNNPIALVSCLLLPALNSLVESLFDVLPVDDFPYGLHVIGTSTLKVPLPSCFTASGHIDALTYLVLEVIGVLPHVYAEEGDEA